ncbi:cytidine deaminase-like protein [Scleroderma yunnanense]
MNDPDKFGLATALAQARKSYQDGGIPIGAALLYHDPSLQPSDPVVLGCSHNQRIQKSSPTLHAEIAALEDAGRLKADVYRKSTMVRPVAGDLITQPSNSAILLYKIPRVVIGENKTFLGGEELLKEHGVEVKVVDDVECKELLARFVKERPDEWMEDIGKL